MKTQEITYQYEDKNYIGFVAYPEKELAPLVLIAHTWAGRDSFVEEKAKELAELGYVAMAVDMYGDGKVGSSTEENQSLMTPLVENRNLLKEYEFVDIFPITVSPIDLSYDLSLIHI